MIPYLVSILSGVYPLIEYRVYPMIIPQLAEYPALRISANGLEGDGTKESISQLDTHSVRFDLFAYSYKEAYELSMQIRSDLDRMHGNKLASGLQIADIIVDNARDGGYEEDKKLFHRILDLTVYTKPIN